MRKSVSSTILALAILLAGMSTVAFAEVTQNLSVPFSAVIVNPCLAEPVALTGQLHILAIAQATGNGILVTSHAQPQGIVGTGLVTGAKYQGTGMTKITMFLDAPPPFDFTYVNNFRIIGHGEANNFLVHSTVRITVNANKEVTATVSNISIECR